MTDSQKLLADYVATGSEPAFRELVARYLDLVYSAAFRLMDGDAHQAEDVAQTVFADLARLARTLARDVMLGGWLHRHTCFVAANFRRSDRRRQNRERQAAEMNAPDHSEANLARVAPVLDEAIDQLGAEDRTAVLLRFFEQRDFRSIGAVLGSNEDAAQKRVTRALEKLQVLLKQRGIAFSAVTLGSVLTAEAVTAAPVGLALGISTAALAGVTAGTGSSLTLIKLLVMTKLKLGILSAVVIAGVATTLVLHQSASREQSEALRRQVDQLAAENARLSNQVSQASLRVEAANLDELAAAARAAAAAQTPASGNGAATNVADAGASARTNDSVLSGITADANMRKLIRDQQKAGMAVIYKGLSKQLNLGTNQTEQLYNVLADDVMDNIDQITKVLKEGKTTEETIAAFAAQDAALQEKMKAMLGPEEYAQYRDYNRNVLTSLVTDQYKATLPGDQALTDEQSKLIVQVMKEETQAVLQEAGLDPDYQAVPILNFRNIASDELMQQSLDRLDSIMNRTAARAAGFFTPNQLAKFSEYHKNAMDVSRMSILMNRKMMSPSGQ